MPAGRVPVRGGSALGGAVLLTALLTAAAPAPEPDPAGELRRAVYADVFAGGDGLSHLPVDLAAELDPLRALRASRPLGPPAPELLTAAPEGTRALRGVGTLLVLAPAGEPFALDTAVLPGARLRGWWYDPRTGVPIDAGTVPRGRGVPFFPPATGPGDAGRDWVLVVDGLPLGPPGSA
jgi:hypothetical protein